MKNRTAKCYTIPVSSVNLSKVIVRSSVNYIVVFVLLSKVLFLIISIIKIEGSVFILMLSIYKKEFEKQNVLILLSIRPIRR